MYIYIYIYIHIYIDIYTYICIQTWDKNERELTSCKLELVERLERIQVCAGTQSAPAKFT